MSIETDSTPLEDPKKSRHCNAFAIYKLLATEDQLATMTNHHWRELRLRSRKTSLVRTDMRKPTKPRKYNYYIRQPS
jgi:tryptophanyl-tRNA synthetase